MNAKNEKNPKDTKASGQKQVSPMTEELLGFFNVLLEGFWFSLINSHNLLNTAMRLTFPLTLCTPISLEFQWKDIDIHPNTSKIPPKDVWDGNKKWEVASCLFTADIEEQVWVFAHQFVVVFFNLS